MNKIIRCSRCIMDNSSDNTIIFDKDGLCNYCTDALKRMNDIYFPNEEGQIKLEQMLSRLKWINRNKEYDCIMGLSGGLDSSYLAYLGYKWGLRILAYHVNDGYDTEIAKENFEKLTKACNIKMNVISPNQEQFIDLTKSFMYAGVPNLAMPQDNVLFA